MYLYIYICILLSIILVLGAYVYNRPIIYRDSKLLRYECGVEEYQDSNIYTIMYYKIAVTYLVFDIETILLFPTSLLPTTNSLLLVLILFLIILIIGLIIEYLYDIYN